MEEILRENPEENPEEKFQREKIQRKNPSSPAPIPTGMIHGSMTGMLEGNLGTNREDGMLEDAGGMEEDLHLFLSSCPWKKRRNNPAIPKWFRLEKPSVVISSSHPPSSNSCFYFRAAARFFPKE